jgi:hypothetical protein
MKIGPQWKDNILVDLQEIIYKDDSWTQRAQARFHISEADSALESGFMIPFENCVFTHGFLCR